MARKQELPRQDVKIGNGLQYTCLFCGERHKATAKRFPKQYHKNVYDKETGTTVKVLAGYGCVKCCRKADNATVKGVK